MSDHLFSDDDVLYSATARTDLIEAATIAAEYLTKLKRTLDLDLIGYDVLDKLESALREQCQKPPHNISLPQKPSQAIPSYTGVFCVSGICPYPYSGVF